MSLNQLGTVYATKRRRRNGKSLKPPPKDGAMAKSNPSKRHRERLNAELDTLASLLPFEQNILSKLDRLSILRLAVSYLRTKSYFQVSMVREKEESGGGVTAASAIIAEYARSLSPYDNNINGELFLQALNGFLMILTCEGEVFFATHSIESYLGFHQSDIVHQSVYELVHSEDREELQRQLLWNAFFPSELSGLSLQETIHTPDYTQFLERSFTLRFRCLLDNTSGFLRLDIRGRVKMLHGQKRKSEEPTLALFALCTPFGPPSLLEVPQKEVMFKSKHKLDLSLISMDQRGKMLLGYSDSELVTLGGYDLVHHDDLAYVASAHQELLKTGASGLIAYRLHTKDSQWQWLQTSSRLVYKNSKPDFIISTHRPLMEEEGRDLLGKRTMDFKVSYLDADLTNSYFTDLDSSTSTPVVSSSPPKTTRRYKTQLRDFLASCRSVSKRSKNSNNNTTNNSSPSSVAPSPLIPSTPHLLDHQVFPPDPSGLLTASAPIHHHHGNSSILGPGSLSGSNNISHHNHHMNGGLGGSQSSPSSGIVPNPPSAGGTSYHTSTNPYTINSMYNYNYTPGSVGANHDYQSYYPSFETPGHRYSALDNTLFPYTTARTLNYYDYPNYNNIYYEPSTTHHHHHHLSNHFNNHSENHHENESRPTVLMWGSSTS